MNKIQILLIFVSIKGGELSFEHSRIAGGTNAEKDQFPFFAQINITEPRQGYNLQRTCGSTLIHPEWIISASHCFQGFRNISELIERNLLVIYMGTNVRYDKNATRNFIKKVYTHPDFLIKRSDKGHVLETKNDIAVAQLKKPYILNKLIKVISLPQPIQNMGKWTKSCKSGTAVGIGITKPGAAFDPNVLYAEMDPKQLKDLKVGKIQIVFRKNQIQYNTTFFTLKKWLQGHTMSGDSGGPFVCYQDKKPIIYGITSLGAHNLAINNQFISIGIFERVDQHLDFIRSKVPIWVDGHKNPGGNLICGLF